MYFHLFSTLILFGTFWVKNDHDGLASSAVATCGAPERSHRPRSSARGSSVSWGFAEIPIFTCSPCPAASWTHLNTVDLLKEAELRIFPAHEKYLRLLKCQLYGIKYFASDHRMLELTLVCVCAAARLPCLRVLKLCNHSRSRHL